MQNHHNSGRSNYLSFRRYFRTQLKSNASARLPNISLDRYIFFILLFGHASPLVLYVLLRSTTFIYVRFFRWTFARTHRIRTRSPLGNAPLWQSHKPPTRNMTRIDGYITVDRILRKPNQFIYF